MSCPGETDLDEAFPYSRFVVIVNESPVSPYVGFSEEETAGWSIFCVVSRDVTGVKM